MSRATRDALNVLERSIGRIKIKDAAYQVLIIVRSAMDMREAQNIRIRQGLLELIKAVQLSPIDMGHALKHHALLLRHAIIRTTDKPQVTSILANYVKTLKHGTGLRDQHKMNEIAEHTSREFDIRLETYQRKRMQKRLQELQRRAQSDQRVRMERMASARTKLSSSVN